MKSKPAGVIALAILAFLNAIPLIISIFSTKFAVDGLYEMSHRQLDLNNFGLGLTVLSFLLAAYLITVGIGMLLLQNWARILYLINTWIGTIWSGLGAMISLVLIFAVGPAALLVLLIQGVILTVNIIILNYLYKDEIAEVFTQPSHSDSFKELESGIEDPDELDEFDEDEVTSSKMEINPTRSKTIKNEKETRVSKENHTKIAMLIEDHGGGRYKSFDILKAKTSIGRSSRNDIILKDDQTVGREHAQIIFRNRKFWLYDLASTNGTYLNNKKIEKHDLLEGDEILIGEHKFIFKTHDT